MSSGHGSDAVAHRDYLGAKIGMWLFLVTEIILFGGLFIGYSYMRARYPLEFHSASHELSVLIGVLNTVVLLTSSLTMALSITAVQKGDSRKTRLFLVATVLLGVLFLVNKSIEWGAKFHHGLYPNSALMGTKPPGEQVFFGLYFSMTGLHGLHVLVGVVLLGVMLILIMRERIHQHDFVKLENAGLYWHLVDVIWIFLLPLFYLAA